MASVLKEGFDINPTDVGKEFADKFYEKYLSEASSFGTLLAQFFSSSASEEDLQFFINNHKFFNEIQKSYIWNLPAGDLNLGYLGKWKIVSDKSGLLTSFQGEFPTNDTYRKIFLLYAGAYLNNTRIGEAGYKKAQRDRNDALVQDVFYTFEKNGTIFKEVSASLKEFSFNNFKTALSKSINVWLDSSITGPLIEGLLYIERFS